MGTDDFFADFPQAAALYRRVEAAIATLEGAQTLVQHTQIRFARGHPFAAVWIPERQLKRPGAPLVLSIFARRRIRSRRFKEITEARPGRFTHHIELWREGDIDAQLRRWLKMAWEQAA